MLPVNESEPQYTAMRPPAPDPPLTEPVPPSAEIVPLPEIVPVVTQMPPPDPPPEL